LNGDGGDGVRGKRVLGVLDQDYPYHMGVCRNRELPNAMKLEGKGVSGELGCGWDVDVDVIVDMGGCEVGGWMVGVYSPCSWSVRVNLITKDRGIIGVL
jgi:hypothetical protein